MARLKRKTALLYWLTADKIRHPQDWWEMKLGFREDFLMS